MRTNGFLRAIAVSALMQALAAYGLHAQLPDPVHIVREGETLYGIASMYNTNVEALKSANAGISDNIAAGQKLVIPTASGSRRFHTIAAGETLYSISRKYNVDIADIVKANPGLDEKNFKSGATIIIPSAAASAGASAARSKQEGIAGSNCKEMYKVKKKDTFFSVANKFGFTVEELAAANPDVPAPDYSIKKGDYLCIPFPPDKNAVSNAQAFGQNAAPAPKSRIRVSLILPFYGSAEEARRSTVFYRGFLAAADSLRKGGISFDITAKDAGGFQSGASGILQDNAIRSSDLIIASAGEAGLKALADCCKGAGAKLFVPFDNEFHDVFSNPQVILSGQPASYNRAAAAQYIASRYSRANIIYVDCLAGDTQKSYAGALLSSLEANGIPYRKTSLDASGGEFAKLFDPGRRNVVILSSASKESYMAAAKRLDEISPSLAGAECSLFGHQEWTDFDMQLRNTFFKYDTTILTPQYINVFSSFYPQFLEMYKASFGRTPDTSDQRAFFLGFDTGMHLLQGLASYGAAFGTQEVRGAPMERPVSLARVNNWGGMMNKAYRVVRFTKRQTTEITDYAQ